MSFLVDTNVLVRLIQQSHAMHADARESRHSFNAADFKRYNAITVVDPVSVK